MKGFYLAAWISSLAIVLLAVHPSGTGASSVQFTRRGPGDFRDRDKLALFWRSRIRRKRADTSEIPQHYIKVALVFDESFLPPLGLKEETLERFAVNITEAVDQTFRQFQTTTLLVAVETWISKEHMNVSSPQLLFEEFRRYSRSLPMDHDVAFLLMFNSSDTEKSMTSFDSICQRNRATAGVIQVSDNVNPVRVSTLISRGIATSIGLLQDSDVCHCGSHMCLMNVSIISATPGFSDCSDQTFQNAYNRGKLWCLDPPPRNIQLIEAPLCGNGIVQTGEECDCNNDTECLKCCRDCSLVKGAECAGGLCCNDQCKLLMTGSVCRERTGPCDIPEYCTGNSEHCPENLVLHNGATCKKQGMCQGGVCETMQDQCSQLWGEGSLLSRTACSTNITAEIHRTASQYRDAKCGLLICDVTDADMTSLQARSLMEIADWSNTEPQCKVVSVALSDGSNRGAVSDGTVCGRSRVCHQGTCVPVTRPSCPAGISNKICSGNGVCAISGQCVCFCGWRGPSCAVRNSTREGSLCIPKSRFSTNDVTTNQETPPTESNDKLNDGEVRVLTSAIIGGSLAIIFVVAIIFGATSIGFKKAKKHNQARRMQQVKLFSMFQPTKQQKKRLAKFGGGRSPYKAGELEGASSSMAAPSSHATDHHHHHHIPKHHNHHHGGGGQPGGRMHGKNKKQQKKVRLLIDMHTHKPDKAGGSGQARAETII